MIQTTQEQLAQDLLEFVPIGTARAAAAAIAEKRGATKAETQKPKHRVTARGVSRGPEDKFPTYGAGGHLWPKDAPATFELTDNQIQHVREQAAAGHLMLISAEPIEADKPATPPPQQPQQQSNQQQQNRR